MRNLDQIYRLVAKQLNEDPDVVHKVVMFQFQQIAERMKDPTDIRDILINELFKFKLKTRYKENKQLKYTAR